MEIHQGASASASSRLNRSGLRKVTSGLKRAEALAARYSENETVSKTLVWRVVAEAAAPLGLSGSAQVILNLLFKRSKPSDWDDASHHPIVWPSNDELCRQSGFAVGTVRRSLRTLVDHGLIAYADSNNGKRRGFRNHDGTLVKAFGFDLAPSAVRYNELKTMIERIRIEDRMRYDYREEITTQRRAIRATIEAARSDERMGDWTSLSERYCEITDGLRTERLILTELQSLLHQLIRLRAAVDHAWGLTLSTEEKSTFYASNHTGLGTNNHVHDTDYNRSINRNLYLERRDANAPQHPLAASGSEGSSDKERVRDAGTNPHVGRVRKAQELPISFELLATACPSSRDYKAFIRNWSDVQEIAEIAVPALGINRSAWVEACQTMGREIASVSIVVILEKMNREPLSIKSPGGYLRAMTERYREGQLNLSGSLMGLAKRELEKKLN